MAFSSWVPEIGALCFSGTEPVTLFNLLIYLMDLAVMFKDDM